MNATSVLLCLPIDGKAFQGHKIGQVVFSLRKAILGSFQLAFLAVSLHCSDLTVGVVAGDKGP